MWEKCKFQFSVTGISIDQDFSALGLRSMQTYSGKITYFKGQGGAQSCLLSSTGPETDIASGFLTCMLSREETHFPLKLPNEKLI